jgi:hypothetical protein
VRDTKADGGEGDEPTSKPRQGVYPRTDLRGQRAAFKTELLHLAGGEDDKTKLQLKCNTVATWE